MLCDIHCHLDDSAFDKDRDKVVQRAIDTKVVRIITCGIDRLTNQKALALAEKYTNVYAALGRYPFDALENDGHYERNPEAIRTTIEDEIAFIKNHAKKCIAIAKCGLDLHHGKDITKQIEEFKKMIELAIELKKPLVIHSRKAEEQTLEVLESYKDMLNPHFVVLHCFSGRKKMIERAIKNKYMLSIPPSVIRSQQFQNMIKMTPLNQLLTETDSPFLSPYKREDGTSTRNEPAFVIESVKIIAQLKGLTEQDCMHQLFMNYQKVF